MALCEPDQDGGPCGQSPMSECWMSKLEGPGRPAEHPQLPPPSAAQDVRGRRPGHRTLNCPLWGAEGGSHSTAPLGLHTIMPPASQPGPSPLLCLSHILPSAWGNRSVLSVPHTQFSRLAPTTPQSPSCSCSIIIKAAHSDTIDHYSKCCRNVCLLSLHPTPVQV